MASPSQPDPDYGDSFADVYDEWYHDITDADATARRVAALARGAGNHRVLELGIGSGRLALPIAELGFEVTGVDLSEAMLERLRHKPGAERLTVVHGDMVDAAELVDGPFAVVLVAFNTLFNVTTEDRQRRCIAGAAALLGRGGSLLVEAFIPPPPPDRIERGLSTARVSAESVVLSATEHDPAAQTITGQHVELANDGNRIRPWRIRYLTPDQLDEMARAAGLELLERHADWNAAKLDSASTTHVSRYGRRDRP